MDFRIEGLPADHFQHLFGMPDDELSDLGIHRIVADSKPGYPCRISLEDAEPGDKLLLLNFDHQPVNSPYRSSHAIFIREWARTAELAINEVPELLQRRLLSVRGFDTDGMMIEAEIVEGRKLETQLQALLSNAQVDYVHIHNAARGCYAATAVAA